MNDESKVMGNIRANRVSGDLGPLTTIYSDSTILNYAINMFAQVKVNLAGPFCICFDNEPKYYS